MIPETARKADPSELDVIAETLATAFADDPVFRWLYAEEHRARASRLFFAEIVDALAPHDDIWTTQPEIVGAAVWIPYGHEEMSPERAQQFSARLAELPGVHRDRAGRLSALVSASHPSEPHEYLRFLGVVPAERSSGVGSRLMAPVLRRADDAGHPAFLVSTSARSKALYERHGFVAREPLQPAEDGPTLWPMWREPRART